MKRLFAGWVASLVPSLGLAREILPLDHGWEFHMEGKPPGAVRLNFDAVPWQKVDLPHDWSIAGAFEKSAPPTGSGAWLPSGVAWYRKDLPAFEKGQRVWVEFDGVMANSQVSINGTGDVASFAKRGGPKRPPKAGAKRSGGGTGEG